jgi:hypothetical protein
MAAPHAQRAGDGADDVHDVIEAAERQVGFDAGYFQDEIEREQDQQEIDVPPQPGQLMFTKMPEKFALGDVTVCPRCLGHKRGPRPEHIKKRGGVVIEMVLARDAEDFTRDPFKPTAKSGEPNRCPRCNGFGIVPTAGI